MSAAPSPLIVVVLSEGSYWTNWSVWGVSIGKRIDLFRCVSDLFNTQNEEDGKRSSARGTCTTREKHLMTE